MKQLQKWFDQIAGIHREEQERQALARRVFSQRGPDPLLLQMPACWRRKARIGRI
ncbi:hypothetical protein [Dechloromonas sp. ZS-1]|jgi:hypothetical protein|uniref:hypothetical protein n=1 Tax=Dechloromonas sp. ZS-1 TaxID=3138067 RepID=UPI0031FE2914